MFNVERVVEVLMKVLFYHNSYRLISIVVLQALLQTVHAQQNEQQRTQLASEAGSSEIVSIEEIEVVGESKDPLGSDTSISLVEDTRSVSVIDEAIFRDFGALYLDDVLDYTAGSIGDTFGFSTRTVEPVVRGFAATIYRDNLQVGFGSDNNTRTEVFFLERVEVLKGPSATLFGKGSPGGVINTVTKVARLDQENEVILDAGNFDYKQLGIDLNHNLSETIALRLVGVVRDKDTQVDGVFEKVNAVLPSITYEADSTSVTTLFEYIERDSRPAHQFLPLQITACLSEQIDVESIYLPFGGEEFEVNPCYPVESASSNIIDIPDELEVPFSYRVDNSTSYSNDAFDRYDTRSSMAGLILKHSFNESLSTKTNVRYKDALVYYNHSFIQFQALLGPRVSPPFFRDSSFPDYNDGVNEDFESGYTWRSTEAGTEQLALDHQFQWSVASNYDLVVGLAHQNLKIFNDYALVTNGFINPYNYIALPLTEFTSVERDITLERQNVEISSLYINQNIVFNTFKLNLGYRFDDVVLDTFNSGKETTGLVNDNVSSYSVGANYEFNAWLSVYGSYSESYEVELDVDRLTGEPLKPRFGEQFEAGIKYRPDYPSGLVTLSLFKITENNIRDPNALQNTIPSQQEGEAENKGLELEANLMFDQFEFLTALSLNESENAFGRDLDKWPHKQAKFWLSYKPEWLTNFKVGAGARYFSQNQNARNLELFRGTPNFVETTFLVRTGGYTLFDAKVGYEYRNYNFTLNIRNIEDKEYYSTCLARGDCFPVEARTITGRMAINF